MRDVIIKIGGVVLGSCITLFLAAYQDDTDRSGFVGDIRYSLLEPSVFMSKHPGWILLAGDMPAINDEYQSSKLKGIHRFPNLPDVRGKFIRSMNVGQSVDKGDAEGDRPIGDPQGDDFAAHTHVFPNNNFTHTGWTRLPGGDVTVSANLKTSTGQTETKGGKETRPRSITLYTYVKIN
ncbi:hypothetical protein [Dyadobacter bucti]|uniref:hypothetical protein n=1 Tax=Dyadobacter bucti TaxID=2572203 RepID=UPI001107FE1E|nr:hypothetical protein [Dyadobacter bucti]